MRTCGAEKLPWLVVEVEVDAERAGCFAERQVRLGLGVDEAIPETCDRLGGPAERTKARLRVRIGAVHDKEWIAVVLRDKEWIAVVLRMSSATLTSTRADAAYLRSANRTDHPGKPP